MVTDQEATMPEPQVMTLVEALEAYFEAKDNYMPEQDGFYVQADASLRAALAAVGEEV